MAAMATSHSSSDVLRDSSSHRSALATGRSDLSGIAASTPTGAAGRRASLPFSPVYDPAPSSQCTPSTSCSQLQSPRTAASVQGSTIQSATGSPVGPLRIDSDLRNHGDGHNRESGNGARSFGHVPEGAGAGLAAVPENAESFIDGMASPPSPYAASETVTQQEPKDLLSATHVPTINGADAGSAGVSGLPPVLDIPGDTMATPRSMNCESHTVDHTPSGDVTGHYGSGGYGSNTSASSASNAYSDLVSKAIRAGTERAAASHHGSSTLSQSADRTTGVLHPSHSTSDRPIVQISSASTAGAGAGGGSSATYQTPERVGVRGGESPVQQVLQEKPQATPPQPKSMHGSVSADSLKQLTAFTPVSAEPIHSQVSHTPPPKRTSVPNRSGGGRGATSSASAAAGSRSGAHPSQAHPSEKAGTLKLTSSLSGSGAGHMSPARAAKPRTAPTKARHGPLVGPRTGANKAMRATPESTSKRRESPRLASGRGSGAGAESGGGGEGGGSTRTRRRSSATAEAVTSNAASGSGMLDLGSGRAQPPPTASVTMHASVSAPFSLEARGRNASLTDSMTPTTSPRRAVLSDVAGRAISPSISSAHGSMRRGSNAASPRGGRLGRAGSLASGMGDFSGASPARSTDRRQSFGRRLSVPESRPSGSPAGSQHASSNALTARRSPSVAGLTTGLADIEAALSRAMSGRRGSVAGHAVPSPYGTTVTSKRASVVSLGADMSGIPNDQSGSATPSDTHGGRDDAHGSARFLTGSHPGSAVFGGAGTPPAAAPSFRNQTKAQQVRAETVERETAARRATLREARERELRELRERHGAASESPGEKDHKHDSFSQPPRRSTSFGMVGSFLPELFQSARGEGDDSDELSPLVGEDIDEDPFSAARVESLDRRTHGYQGEALPKEPEGSISEPPEDAHSHALRTSNMNVSAAIAPFSNDSATDFPSHHSASPRRGTVNIVEFGDGNDHSARRKTDAFGTSSLRLSEADMRLVAAEAEKVASGGTALPPIKKPVSEPTSRTQSRRPTTNTGKMPVVPVPPRGRGRGRAPRPSDPNGRGGGSVATSRSPNRKSGWDTSPGGGLGQSTNSADRSAITGEPIKRSLLNQQRSVATGQVRERRRGPANAQDAMRRRREKAAVRLQRWWRGAVWRIKVKRQLREDRDVRRKRALRIVRRFFGKCARMIRDRRREAETLVLAVAVTKVTAVLQCRRAQVEVLIRLNRRHETAARRIVEAWKRGPLYRRLVAARQVASFAHLLEQEALIERRAILRDEMTAWFDLKVKHRTSADEALGGQGKWVQSLDTMSRERHSGGVGINLPRGALPPRSPGFGFSGSGGGGWTPSDPFPIGASPQQVAAARKMSFSPTRRRRSTINFATTTSPGDVELMRVPAEAVGGNSKDQSPSVMSVTVSAATTAAATPALPLSSIVDDAPSLLVIDASDTGDGHSQVIPTGQDDDDEAEGDLGGDGLAPDASAMRLTVSAARDTDLSTLGHSTSTATKKAEQVALGWRRMSGFPADDQAGFANFGMLGSRFNAPVTPLGGTSSAATSFSGYPPSMRGSFGGFGGAFGSGRVPDDGPSGGRGESHASLTTQQVTQHVHRSQSYLQRRGSTAPGGGFSRRSSVAPSWRVAQTAGGSGGQAGSGAAAGRSGQATTPNLSSPAGFGASFGGVSAVTVNDDGPGGGVGGAGAMGRKESFAPFGRRGSLAVMPPRGDDDQSQLGAGLAVPLQQRPGMSRKQSAASFLSAIALRSTMDRSALAPSRGIGHFFGHEEDTTSAADKRLAAFGSDWADAPVALRSSLQWLVSAPHAPPVGKLSVSHGTLGPHWYEWFTSSVHADPATFMFSQDFMEWQQQHEQEQRQRDEYADIDVAEEYEDSRDDEPLEFNASDSTPAVMGRSILSTGGRTHKPTSSVFGALDALPGAGGTSSGAPQRSASVTSGGTSASVGVKESVSRHLSVSDASGATTATAGGRRSPQTSRLIEHSISFDVDDLPDGSDRSDRRKRSPVEVVQDDSAPQLQHPGSEPKPTQRTATASTPTNGDREKHQPSETSGTAEQERRTTQPPLAGLQHHRAKPSPTHGASKLSPAQNSAKPPASPLQSTIPFAGSPGSTPQRTPLSPGLPHGAGGGRPPLQPRAVDALQTGVNYTGGGLSAVAGGGSGQTVSAGYSVAAAKVSAMPAAAEAAKVAERLAQRLPGNLHATSLGGPMTPLVPGDLSAHDNPLSVSGAAPLAASGSALSFSPLRQIDARTAASGDYASEAAQNSRQDMASGSLSTGSHGSHGATGGVKDLFPDSRAQELPNPTVTADFARQELHESLGLSSVQAQLSAHGTPHAGAIAGAHPSGTPSSQTSPPANPQDLVLSQSGHAGHGQRPLPSTSDVRPSPADNKAAQQLRQRTLSTGQTAGAVGRGSGLNQGLSGSARGRGQGAAGSTPGRGQFGAFSATVQANRRRGQEMARDAEKATVVATTASATSDLAPPLGSPRHPQGPRSPPKTDPRPRRQSTLSTTSSVLQRTASTKRNSVVSSSPVRQTPGRQPASPRQATPSGKSSSVQRARGTSSGPASRSRGRGSAAQGGRAALRRPQPTSARGASRDAPRAKDKDAAAASSISREQDHIKEQDGATSTNEQKSPHSADEKEPTSDQPEAGIPLAPLADPAIDSPPSHETSGEEEAAVVGLASPLMQRQATIPPPGSIPAPAAGSLIHQLDDDGVSGDPITVGAVGSVSAGVSLASHDAADALLPGSVHATPASADKAIPAVVDTTPKRLFLVPRPPPSAPQATPSPTAMHEGASPAPAGGAQNPNQRQQPLAPYPPPLRVDGDLGVRQRGGTPVMTTPIVALSAPSPDASAATEPRTNATPPKERGGSRAVSPDPSRREKRRESFARSGSIFKRASADGESKETLTVSPSFYATAGGGLSMSVPASKPGSFATPSRATTRASTQLQPGALRGVVLDFEAAGHSSGGHALGGGGLGHAITLDDDGRDDPVAAAAALDLAMERMLTVETRLRERVELQWHTIAFQLSTAFMAQTEQEFGAGAQLIPE